jgi:hypothetical protein
VFINRKSHKQTRKPPHSPVNAYGRRVRLTIPAVFPCARPGSWWAIREGEPPGEPPWKGAWHTRPARREPRPGLRGRKVQGLVWSSPDRTEKPKMAWVLHLGFVNLILRADPLSTQMVPLEPKYAYCVPSGTAL